jgi:hypothetical protein
MMTIMDSGLSISCGSFSIKEIIALWVGSPRSGKGPAPCEKYIALPIFAVLLYMFYLCEKEPGCIIKIPSTCKASQYMPPVFMN